MNKFYIYLKEKILFALTGLILFTGLMGLSGCSLFEGSPLVLSTTELQVSLPDTALIPFDVSRWEVKVTSGGKTNCFYVDGSKRCFNVSVDSNYPAAISATPLVISPLDSKETAFFKSAGQIYPYGKDYHNTYGNVAVPVEVIVNHYDCPPPPLVYETGTIAYYTGEDEKKSGDSDSGGYAGIVSGDMMVESKRPDYDDQLELTWEDGFVAYIMERLFMGSYSYYKKPEVVKYIAGFNWIRFQMEIRKKCDEGYNPWLIDAENLLTSIAYKNFNTYSINLKDATSVSCDSIQNLLCSYVPYNKKISEKSEIWLKESEVNVFSDYNLYNVMISANNGTVRALENVSLPLYGDNYEQKCEENFSDTKTMGCSYSSYVGRVMP